MAEQVNQKMNSETYNKMTADVYDALYTWKDYDGEAKKIKEYVEQSQKSDGNELLDVACGTGLHLPHLVDSFKVTGVDLSEPQLEAARKRLPELDFVQADMRNFDLGRQFDAITCLFSSIGYVQTQEGLVNSVGAMSKHLKPGGVLLIEPWLSKERYDPDAEHPPTIGTLPDGTKVTRTSKHGVDGNISVMIMHHDLDGPNGHTEFDEEHRLAMFSVDDFKQAFGVAGLSFAFSAEGLASNHDKSRGLYIGVKPLNS